MKSKLLGAVFAAAISIVFANAVQASTVYTYTGPTFDPALITDDPIPAGSYTSSMNVTGSFTVAGPLISFSGVLTPLSFSFSDGRNTITNLNDFAPDAFINIQTDISGNIVAWGINVDRWVGGFGAPNVGDQMIEIIANGVGGISVDRAVFDERLSDLTFGEDMANTDQNGSPASWSSSPIPATLPLFATGLGALGLLARRRKRKVIATA